MKRFRIYFYCRKLAISTENAIRIMYLTTKPNWTGLDLQNDINLIAPLIIFGLMFCVSDMPGKFPVYY